MHDRTDSRSKPMGALGMEQSYTPDSGDKTYFYELDSDDRIVFCSDTWDGFANDNDGSHLAFDSIQGQSIWAHISCERTVGLYQRIFTSARAGKPVQFFLRCDSPKVRRLLHVSVSPTIEGRVRTTTLLFRADERDPLPTVMCEEKRADDECYTLCTWCNKLDATGWQELEDVVGHHVPDGEARPTAVRHGMCDPCYDRIDQILIGH